MTSSIIRILWRQKTKDEGKRFRVVQPCLKSSFKCKMKPLEFRGKFELEVQCRRPKYRLLKTVLKIAIFGRSFSNVLLKIHKTKLLRIFCSYVPIGGLGNGRCDVEVEEIGTVGTVPLSRPSRTGGKF